MLSAMLAAPPASVAGEEMFELANSELEIPAL
jgi:hypothetical protein